MMSRIHPIAFLAAGAALLVYGLNADGPFAPAEVTIWLIVAGVLGILAGTFSIFNRRSQ
jgi:hypothetical protein